MAQIAILEGYTMPRRTKRRYGKAGRKAAMKTCARKHKVTSRAFHACVRRKVGKKRR